MRGARSQAIIPNSNGGERHTHREIIREKCLRCSTQAHIMDYRNNKVYLTRGLQGRGAMDGTAESGVR